MKSRQLTLQMKLITGKVNTIDLELHYTACRILLYSIQCTTGIHYVIQKDSQDFFQPTKTLLKFCHQWLQVIVGLSFLVILARKKNPILPWDRLSNLGVVLLSWWLPSGNICFCSLSKNIAAMYLKLPVYVTIVISFHDLGGDIKITFSYDF